jgi:hypothetical protein
MEHGSFLTIDIAKPSSQSQAYLSRHFSHPILVLAGTPVVGVRGSSIWGHMGVLQGLSCIQHGFKMVYQSHLSVSSFPLPLQLLL